MEEEEVEESLDDAPSPAPRPTTRTSAAQEARITFIGVTAMPKMTRGAAAEAVAEDPPALFSWRGLCAWNAVGSCVCGATAALDRDMVVFTRTRSGGLLADPRARNGDF